MRKGILWKEKIYFLFFLPKHKILLNKKLKKIKFIILRKSNCDFLK
jgi:hypothetical protein